MEIQLAMVVLEVRDLDASIAFYRRLGLDVPDPVGGRPVTVHRMGSGVSLLLTTPRRPTSPLRRSATDDGVLSQWA